jgi:PAS domain S-box-containing protein
MNDLTSLPKQIKLVFERILGIYQVAAVPPSTLEQLSIVLAELGIITESLQVAIADLEHQQAEMVRLHAELAIKNWRYQHLLESVPEGCLITNTEFVIQDVNHAGASLFNLSTHQLKHKSLKSLICGEDLPLVQAKIDKACYQKNIEFSTRLRRYPDRFFDAEVRITALHERGKNALYLQWLLQDNTAQNQTQTALEASSNLPYATFHFSKGETIPLEPHQVWFVASGIAKLTTLSERGENTLLGIVTEAMTFGANFTALHTYQVTALSDIKLALVPVAEISQSPHLAQVFLASLKQRLKQTEKILAIYGQIRVEERLNELLLLLKQVIGEPVAQGTRLRARLTHQDFASACCTTRVTVTRLLRKLQEQGKLTQDAQNHLILKE